MSVSNQFRHCRIFPIRRDTNVDSLGERRECQQVAVYKSCSGPSNAPFTTPDLLSPEHDTSLTVVVVVVRSHTDLFIALCAVVNATAFWYTREKANEISFHRAVDSMY